jgi:hypothetical protein
MESVKNIRNFQTSVYLPTYMRSLEEINSYKIIPITALFLEFSRIYGHSWLFSGVFENFYSRYFKIQFFLVQAHLKTSKTPQNSSLPWILSKLWQLLTFRRVFDNFYSRNSKIPNLEEKFTWRTLIRTK